VKLALSAATGMVPLQGECCRNLPECVGSWASNKLQSFNAIRLCHHMTLIGSYKLESIKTQRAAKLVML